MEFSLNRSDLRLEYEFKSQMMRFTEKQRRKNSTKVSTAYGFCRQIIEGKDMPQCSSEIKNKFLARDKNEIEMT